MANEITQTVNLSFTKGGATNYFATTSRIDMTGTGFNGSTQEIGTTAELLDLSGVTGSPGQLAIKNLDATNFVEIGGDSGLTVFKIKLRPGKSMLIEPTSGTIYAKANTAACLIQKLAIDA